MPRPDEPRDVEHLRELVAAGRTPLEAAREIGLPQRRIREMARRYGLVWSMQANPAGASAHRERSRQRRRRLLEGLEDDLEMLREQLWRPAHVFAFGGKENTFSEATLDQPTIADQQRLVQAINVGLAAIQRIEEMDADQGVGDATSILDRIEAALTRVAADLDDVL